MHVVHISCELAPIAKVGGLADVVSGLSQSLLQKGQKVEIILPKYDCMDLSIIKDLKIYKDDLESYYDKGMIKSKVWSGHLYDVPLFLIDPENLTHYFKRGCIYGCADDVERFTFFSRASLEFLTKTNRDPDVIHLHDWQTAVAAPLCKSVFKNLKSKVVFTTHNLGYQGQCEAAVLDRIGLKSQEFLSMDKLLDNEHASIINLSKGAIVYSDYTTTVSPTYAEEVRSSTGGNRLHKNLSEKGDRFIGILNGIDTKYWNPATDPYIPHPFSTKNPANKKALQNELHMGNNDKPMVACIARLVPQKGPHLIKAALYRTLEKGGQFVLLGSSPVPDLQALFLKIKNEFHNHPDVHLAMDYNEGLSHKIYAASDMFIVPSLFEPCGLTPLIAMRYGSIPIVRKTGGLADTIIDVDYSGKPFKSCNGYVFNDPDESGLFSALDRAIHTWFKDPSRWTSLVQQAMKCDFSWDKPTDKYIGIYTNL